MLLRAISPLFHNIFNICLTSKVQLPISLLNVVNQIIFSSILQTLYVELRISRSISESPLEFEITRVDCIFGMMVDRDLEFYSAQSSPWGYDPEVKITDLEFSYKSQNVYM